MFNLPELEKKILKFWRENNIFKKSIQQRPKKKIWSFYDGPPFATGLPHYGHLLAGVIKDVFPRYFTMKGYRVPRRAGWDCHGLPVEYEVEKELNINSKKEIEEKYGIEKFNRKCQNIVLKYSQEWEKTIERIGRWVDFSHAYKTMDLDYMESVIWVFKKLWDKKLIYRDYRSSPYCPRCSTPLSNFEVNLGYQDNVPDPSIFVKFPIKNQEKTYFLVWTTTPWTLPGNVALALGKDIDYLKIKLDQEYFILAKERLEVIDEKYQLIESYKGKDLLNIDYQPIFKFQEPDKRAWYTVEADFVSTQEGTGIVHIAPAYGEEDFILAKEKNLPLLVFIDQSGKFLENTPWSGLFIKEADQKIIKDLKNKGLLYKSGIIKHTYPFCWRCEAPVYDFVFPAWFIKTKVLKEKLIKNNQKIFWQPSYIKSGRFGKWLEGVKDWNISRNRFWGAPIPVWICKKCKKMEAFGSINEIEKRMENKIKITNLHRPYIDKIKLKCFCGGTMERTPEVLDCWFESGSMPYAQKHYPFENQKEFKRSFPADFIAEGLDQTRGWFYTLHLLATALFNKPAFKNVVVNGLILAEDGRKMSKRLKNYPEPDYILETYGADALRLYFLGSGAVKAQELRFKESEVEQERKTIFTLLNILKFYKSYASENKQKLPKLKKDLDKWIISKLNLSLKNIIQFLDNYDLSPAIREIKEFIFDLSLWWLRRSRKRFKSENLKENKEVSSILGYILKELAKILAPFTPFIAEEIYQQLKDYRSKESVHLENFPQPLKKYINKKILEKMDLVRKIVEKGLFLRKKYQIKVRQPLSSAYLWPNPKLNQELIDLIKEELNLNNIFIKNAPQSKNIVKTEIFKNFYIALDIKITDQLKKQGYLRELIRQINGLRKKLALVRKDIINLYLKIDDSNFKKIIEEFSQELKKEVLAQKIIFEENKKINNFKKQINGKEIIIGLEKIE